MGLLERLLSPLGRAESLQTWPPSEELQKHWEEVEGYRRRYNNKRSEMLSHAPEFNRTDYGREIYTPVAVAREVCNFSAEMLFSAEPQITFESNEELLQKIKDANGLAARLVSIAASIASEGRGGLRIIRSPSVAEVPLITHVHEDQVIWDERHGGFVVGGAVIIERKPARGAWAGQDIYRLVEEHTRGKVSRALYKGTSSQLGKKTKMDSVREFEGLQEEETTGLDQPTLIKWDNVSGGHSDIAGQEAALDRINAEVSYGAEKSQKSRPVSFAPASMFDSQGRIDLSGIIPIRKERYREMGEDDISKSYGTIQPEFQSAEVIAWIDFLIDCTLMFMGYSKASYGRDEGGSADSGKALRLRQARTLLKKAGKDRMATEALINSLAIAMAWEDGRGAERKVADYRTEITLGDGLPRDSVEDAQETALWDGTGAISLEEKIRMRRPDFDDDAVEKEAERIKGEREAAKPQFGVPATGRLEFGEPAQEERNGG